MHNLRFLFQTALILFFGGFIFPFLSVAQQPTLVLPIGHTGVLTSVSFSPDGKTIVTTSRDNTAKIWDSHSGKLLADLKRHTWIVNSASYSPDGKNIVTASEDNTAKIWDAHTGKLVVDLQGHTESVSSASFRNDGLRIVTASQDNTAKIWDTRSGKVLADLKGHTKWLSSASFSPNGLKVVTSSNDKTAKIWDAQTGKIIADLKGHTDAVRSASFSKDGSRIVTTSWDKTAKIWDAYSGKLIADLKGHINSVYKASFSPDSRRIVTASEDFTAKIWDTETGKMTMDLKGHVDGVNSAVFSPDGLKIITASSDKTAKIWDARTGRLVEDLKGHNVFIVQAAFSPDGQKIVTASGDKTAKIWDSKTGKLLNDLKAHNDVIFTASFSPDGDRIVTSSGDRSAKIWSVQTGNLIANLKGHTKDVISATFSNDGSKIVTASGDQTAKIWDAQTGKLIADLRGHTDYIKMASFSRDGSKIVTASGDETAKLWNAHTGKLITNLRGHTGEVHTALFSPDGRSILTASEDNTPKIWNVNTGLLMVDLKGHTDEITSASYSIDGLHVVTTSWDESAKIWDSRTGKLVANLKGHTDAINSASFSMDGRQVVTASRDSTVKIWDIKTGKIIANLDEYSDYVSEASFSPDNKTIVTTSGDNTAKIWDAKTGKLITNFIDDISFFSFSPDRKKFVTVSYDNSIKIRNVENGELLYTFFTVNSSDYLVVDKDFHFDGTEGGRRLLYFTCGMEIIELDQLKEQLWVPDLVKRISREEKIEAKTLNQLDICGLIPEVKDVSQKNGDYRFFINPRRGGLGTTVVQLNGIDYKSFEPYQLHKIPEGYELLIPKSELSDKFSSSDANVIKIKAYTADNEISARGMEITEITEKKSAAPPTLFAIMVGVSDYKGEQLDLKYAAKDAKDLANALKYSAGKMLNSDGKERVFIYDLTTSDKRYLLPEKNSIKKVFEEIGLKATANDIILVFFAGHGVMGGEKKQFYFLTADASPATAISSFKDVGISTEELTEWMKPQNIKAQKRILIFDACNSGQAINDFVKMGNTDQGYLAARSDDNSQLIKAIDKLNEKAGLFILSASASNQSAYEMERYAQGILTYSLLKVIKQQPDILEQGKYLDLNRWFHAAEQTVTELIRDNGARQHPQIVSNTNFNIGIVDDDVRGKILLPMEKAVFASSNLQNADENIAFDDLGFNSYLNTELAEFATRGSDALIAYAGLSTSNTWIISGRYEIKGKLISVKLNLRQGNNAPKFKFEMTGTLDNLKSFVKAVANRAVSLVKVSYK